MNESFLKTHFDKLLLSGLLLTLFFATIHTLHHAPDTSAINWLENTVGQVLAALLTLMVGQRLTQRNGDKSDLLGSTTLPSTPASTGDGPGSPANNFPAAVPGPEK
jgi:hypothetical protein